MTSKRDKAAQAQDPDTPLLEWICGAVGLAMFLGALVVTGLNAMGPDTPPSIVIQADAPVEANGRFRVEFAAFNRGDAAAADVRLVATLRRGATEVESQEVSIDLLPAHSSKRAGIFFRNDPTAFDLEIAAAGYQRP